MWTIALTGLINTKNKENSDSFFSGRIYVTKLFFNAPHFRNFMDGSADC